MNGKRFLKRMKRRSMISKLAKKITVIYHPETKELSGTVTELKEPTTYGDLFKTRVFGYVDFYPTFEEASEYIVSELQYEYSGKRARDEAADRQYARQEQIACGNW